MKSPNGDYRSSKYNFDVKTEKNKNDQKEWATWNNQFFVIYL